MFYGPHKDIKNLSDHVNTAVRKLSAHLHEFDSIAVRGTSGMLVGSPVAMMLGKPLVVVRKESEHSHSSLLVESIGSIGNRVLFLDDFVSMGDTRNEVRKHVEKKGAKLVAQYLYQTEAQDYTSGAWQLLDDTGWPEDDDELLTESGLVPF